MKKSKALTSTLLAASLISPPAVAYAAPAIADDNTVEVSSQSKTEGRTSRTDSSISDLRHQQQLSYLIKAEAYRKAAALHATKASKYAQLSTEDALDYYHSKWENLKLRSQSAEASSIAKYLMLRKAARDLNE